MNKTLKIIVLTSFACLALVMSACNTTKGFGKDVERGGEKLQNSAEEHGAR